MKYITAVYDGLSWMVANAAAIKEVVDYYAANRAELDALLKSILDAAGYGDAP